MTCCIVGEKGGTGSLSTYTNNILAKTRKSYKHIAPRMETTR